jgi:Asp-tRNA(Asn)/Glu-tRNA(Gln) amidotransferase A subunit family amidase
LRDRQTMTDLCALTAVELIALLRARQTTRLEIATAHLARIEREDERVGAFSRTGSSWSVAASPKTSC